MGRDEQIEERQVLDSIFPDEITDLSDVSYRVSIVLDVNRPHEEDAPPPPTILLTVTYPDSYPDDAPLLDLSAPPNAPKYPDLDIQDDKARLLAVLGPAIEENLGMAMVYALVSTLKDSAELLISERQSATQALVDREAAKVEEEENRKFHGTAVTRKSFLEWRENFIAEMAREEDHRREEREAEDKRKKIKAEERLTGKQLWERGLVGKVDDDEEGEGEEDALKGVVELRVSD